MSADLLEWDKCLLPAFFATRTPQLLYLMNLLCPLGKDLPHSSLLGPVPWTIQRGLGSSYFTVSSLTNQEQSACLGNLNSP